LFFNVNANTAFPCFMASLRSASEAWRAALIVSKASEEGKASGRWMRVYSVNWEGANYRS